MPFPRPQLHAAPAAHAGKTRTYYVAADEVNWDYAPSGRDEAMGMPFDDVAKGFAETSANHIGRVYKKAVYHEYTDATFTTMKPREAKDAYQGIVGPILHAEVGDTIKVVFKNNATHPYGMHPHGVLYEKDSEGANYNGGSGMEDRGACIAPGATHTYTWQVPDRAGPGPTIPVPSSGSTTRTATSCATWLQASSAASSLRAAAWRARTALPRMSTRDS